MKLPEAPWQKLPGLPRLCDALDAQNGKLRFVGGAVRDSLLGLEVTDVDCATPYAPDQVIERLEAAAIRVVPTGIAHGTVTAILEGHPVEITTLRRDVSTDGRHATVEYSEDWEEDAARRDFTINALSADPVTREVFDYFGGETDLAERRVRFIGEPLERIAEDHLRILRFFRFHARFGSGAPDPAGLAAARARANDLMALSRERIADELLKLLALDNPAPTVSLMIKNGIFAPVLPEITSALGTELARLVATETFCSVAVDPVRRLAALFPRDGDGAVAMAARLKMSKAYRKRLRTAAERDSSDQENPRALAYRAGLESATDRLLLGMASPAAIDAALTGLADNPPPARFPLKGGELIAMGIEAGPEVARLLHKIEEAWIAEDFPDAERARAIAKDLMPSE
jgi:poly(A) polymerase